MIKKTIIFNVQGELQENGSFNGTAKIQGNLAELIALLVDLGRRDSGIVQVILATANFLGENAKDSEKLERTAKKKQTRKISKRIIN